jgi:hypothetical protein
MNEIPTSRPPKLRRVGRTGMRRHADALLRIEFDEALAPSIARLQGLLGDLRSAALPSEGPDAVMEATFAARGFHLYPTWPRTTVFYDAASDCFFKTLNRPPRTLRERAHSLITDRARRIHALSSWLVDQGVPIPRVRAFGVVRDGRRPMYAIERAQGQSLYDLLVRAQQGIPAPLAWKVIDAVAGLHGLGYWLGDAHLSHIFVHQDDVSGIIDIDSIRPNRPPRLANLARDLGRLNHPAFPLGLGDGDSLLRRYAARMRLHDVTALARLVEESSSRRWWPAPEDPNADPRGR